jgi:hypothetical protein
MLEFAFTSLTASWIAILATLPIVDSKVKIAPIFTTAGLELTFLLYPLVENSTQKRKRHETNLTAFISIQ